MTIDSSADADYREMVGSYLSSSPGSIPGMVSNFTEAILNEYINNGTREGLRFFDLWHAILEAAMHASDESDQKKLIALVAGIKQKGQHRSAVYLTSQEIDWASLPDFGMVMRHFWNKQPPVASAQSWTNINAFAARCTAAKLQDFTLFGVWTMRDALETQDSSRQSTFNKETRSTTFLPAALEWLKHCGLILAEAAKSGLSFQSPGQQNDPAWLGELALASGVKNSVSSTERWNFWKSRLEEISATVADGPGSLAKATEIARHGLQQMCAVEISMQTRM